MIRILTALLSVVAAVAQAKSSTSSTSLRVTREDAILHRDALIDAVHKKARKLVDATSENGASFVDGESICGYIQESMNFQSVGSKNATGDCTCSGTIEDTLELGCSFQHVYSDTGEVCGSVDMNIKLSNLVDGEGNFSDNPEMDIQACVDVEGEWLEEICLTLVFSGLETSAPLKCEMTYDEQECMCNISSVQVDETFDIEVPCMVWNCSDVVPDSLKPYMAEDTCGLLSGTETTTSFDPMSSSFTALEEIPPDVVTELQAESGGITAHFSIAFVLSTAFLAWL